MCVCVCVCVCVSDKEDKEPLKNPQEAGMFKCHRMRFSHLNAVSARTERESELLMNDILSATFLFFISRTCIINSYLFVLYK